MLARKTLGVANWIIRDANEKARRPLTPLKLIKLMYFSKGWHYAFAGKALFPDHFEAWKYGPVIPDLYREVRKYGAGRITSEITGDEANLEVIEINTLTTVINALSDKSAEKLSAATHQEGSPWSQTIQSSLIDEGLIREYFIGQYGRIKKAST